MDLGALLDETEDTYDHFQIFIFQSFPTILLCCIITQPTISTTHGNEVVRLPFVNYPTATTSLSKESNKDIGQIATVQWLTCMMTWSRGAFRLVAI